MAQYNGSHSSMKITISNKRRLRIKHILSILYFVCVTKAICALQYQHRINYNTHSCSMKSYSNNRDYRQYHVKNNNANMMNDINYRLSLNRFYSRSSSTSLSLVRPSSCYSSNFIHACNNRKLKKSNSYQKTAAALLSSRNNNNIASKSKSTSIYLGLFDESSSDNNTHSGAPLVSSSTTRNSNDGEFSKALERSLLAFLASAIFCFGIYFSLGIESSQEYFAGYLLEQSLSVDNLLVFLLLFDYFNVPQPYQNKILKWGIIGSVVMRAIMISVGAAVINRYHAVLLVFAAILIYSSTTLIASKLMQDDDDEEEDLSNNWIIKFSKSLFPTTERYDGDRFFTVDSGRTVVTPMFLCMVAVELSDVVFAVDSIPAVFGITENPLIVFSSNMFAILGLRSLYTVLAKAASDLKYLEPSVAVVLLFIGMKMVAEYFGTYVPTTLSLGVVITMLSTGVILSLQEKSLEDAIALENEMNNNAPVNTNTIEELLIKEEKEG